ncbi:acyl-CoA N-acyltransferase [Baffinella frigidus]|nr:acyl-CoA N-acyltransferase [Cryptophyta sp. CCMP2293]
MVTGLPAVASAPSDPVLIRTFAVEDAEQVHKVFADGMMAYPEHVDGGVLAPFVKNYISSAIADDLNPEGGMKKTFLEGSSSFWCAVDQRKDSPTHGRIIGIVGGQALDTDPYKTCPEPVMELRRMAVHAGARGLGVASALVKTLEDHARARGICRVVLSTGTVMIAAQRLYERCGYVEGRIELFEEPEFNLSKADNVGFVVLSKLL